MKRANNFKDITNQVFGKLKILSINKIVDKELYWNCLCECGKNCIKRGSNIKAGGTTSCGCLKVSRIEKGLSGFNRLYEDYKAGATKRNLSFSLSKDEFKALTEQDCHYCKIPPKQIMTTSNKKCTKEGKEHSAYAYNGIDRKDNSIGYVLSNCLPCCTLCNRAKHNHPYDLFIDYLNRFRNHNA